MTQMMGVGYLGEVRQGPDGNLYQYVQGVDGLGNPIGGFWSRLKRGLKAVHSLAQRGASFIPGPYGAAIATGLKLATPFCKRPVLRVTTGSARCTRHQMVPCTSRSRDWMKTNCEDWKKMGIAGAR